MHRRMILNLLRALGAILLTLAVVRATTFAQSHGVIPGTGARLDKVGDDFEDEKWSYVFNNPKSSEEQDGQVRLPGGYATNRRWSESAKRGHPDLIQRVPTPEGGLPGSTGSLMLASRATGIPNRWSKSLQQDDFLLNIRSTMGAIPVSARPSMVVRVYVPPFDRFLDHSAASFALRADVVGTKSSGWNAKSEPYWPGMFIVFNSETDRQHAEDSAFLRIRANSRGHDFAGPQITPGWWTLGMSFTPDGRVHYYARQGVEDLTREDYLTSQSPYGFTCTHLNTVMFNIANRDDGRWSTPWIIDDVEVYMLRNPSSTANERGVFRLK